MGGEHKVGRRADQPARWCLASLPFLCLALLPGCPRHGVIDDGTSISYGPSNRGKLIHPTRLPRSGEGFVTPPRWAQRGLRYGTDELVDLIVHAGRRLSAASPGSVIGVADLSKRRGGPSAWHRSHQTGRDADLLFFATDDSGKSVRLESMLHFKANGTAVVATPGQPDQVFRFDVARNWLLVKTLIENPIAEVQYLFIYDPLKQMLLDHARVIGESEDLVVEASWLLHQPGDSAPHDDHLHMRIYCSASDRDYGCRDRGSLRWTKKGAKYGDELSAARAGGASMQAALMAPMPAMMALGVFPFLP